MAILTVGGRGGAGDRGLALGLRCLAGGGGRRAGGGRAGRRTLGRSSGDGRQPALRLGPVLDRLEQPHGFYRTGFGSWSWIWTGVDLLDERLGHLQFGQRFVRLIASQSALVVDQVEYGNVCNLGGRDDKQMNGDGFNLHTRFNIWRISEI